MPSRWRGLVFGVFRSRHTGYRDPDLNFFGLTLTVGLPTVETVHGATWTVLADVGRLPRTSNWSCRPARRRSRTPSSRRCARPPASRSTAPWRPIPLRAPPSRTGRGRARPASRSPRRRPCCGPGGPRSPMSTTGAIRRSSPPRAGTPWSWTATSEPPEAQALWRAAERDGFAPRLFEADRRLEGYGWYDGLDRMAASPSWPPPAATGSGSRTGPCPSGRIRQPRACRPGPTPSASSSPSARRRGRPPRSTFRPTSPSPARPGATSTTRCRW